MRLPPAEIQREAIRTHTPSSKGARLGRSLDAREASHLRNASFKVYRFAAIKKIKLFFCYHPALAGAPLESMKPDASGTRLHPLGNPY